MAKLPVGELKSSGVKFPRRSAPEPKLPPSRRSSASPARAADAYVAGDRRLRLNGRLTWPDILRFLGTSDAPEVRLGERARRHLSEVRERAVALAASASRPIYAWTTDVGVHATERLSPRAETQRPFQRDLLVRSDAGFGSSLSADAVRLALLFRANAMASGETGVRPEVVEQLLALLNAGITPVVPSQGSLGNGDLTQMARIGRALLGHDVPVRYQGREGSARSVLPTAGLAPLQLEMGEAIALLSGSTVVAAELALALKKTDALCELADAALALSCEATRVDVGALDWRDAPREKQAKRVADRLWRLAEGSQWSAASASPSGEEPVRTQDAFSVRTSVQTHALARKAMAAAITELEAELKTAPNNPRVVSRRDGTVRFESSGSSSALDLGYYARGLNEALVQLAELSKARSTRLVDDALLDLKGLVVAQSMTLPLLAEMKRGALSPHHFSNDRKSEQEDVSSLASTSVQRLDAGLDALTEVLCIELLLAARGVEAAKARLGGASMAPGTAQVHALLEGVLKRSPGASPSDDLAALRQAVRSGELVAGLRAVRGGLSGEARPQTQVHRERRLAGWEAVTPASPRPPLLLQPAGAWEPLARSWTSVPPGVAAVGRDLFSSYVEVDDAGGTRAGLQCLRTGEGRFERISLPPGTAFVWSRQDGAQTTHPQLTAFSDKVAVNVPDAPGGPTFLRRGAHDTEWSKAVSGVKRHAVAFCESAEGVFALGGKASPYDWEPPSTHAERLDEATGEWVPMAPLPVPRSGAAALAARGKVYLLGGQPEPNRVDIFDLRSGCWEREPVYLANDWCREVSAWVEDDERIVIASGLSAAGRPVSPPEVLELTGSHRPRPAVATSFSGLEDASQLKVLRTTAGLLALGHAASGPFAKRWVRRP